MPNDGDGISPSILSSATLLVVANMTSDAIEDDDGEDEYDHLIDTILQQHMREQRRLNWSLPMEKQRPTWEMFSERTTNQHFKRMFRMVKEDFSLLCGLVCAQIGSATFRPEAIIMNKHNNDNHPLPRIASALSHTGGFIPGEVKMAISIRMLAGGSYLDIVPLFCVSTAEVYRVVDDFLDWILRTFSFPLVRWLRGARWDILQSQAMEFAEKTSGVFHGTFGALDGLAIRIKSPTAKEVSDPGNYYCRKGFYALNVQAICNKQKQFLWSFPSNKGSTHDSSAFTSSKMYDLLISCQDSLENHGLFIVGDAAYGLTPFLLVPFDSPNIQTHDPDGAKDAFNYFLSANRISIECAFGELVMRWGIFWRTLRFRLGKCIKIIQVCMLLHNFLIERRRGLLRSHVGGRHGAAGEEDGNDDLDDRRYFENFTIDMSDEMELELTRISNEMPLPIVTDNNEPRPAGRPSLSDVALRTAGEVVRNRLLMRLAAANLTRPREANMAYNSQGHIYMTGSR